MEFEEIRADERIPGVYFELDTNAAPRGLPTTAYRLLIVGQRLSSGTVAAGVPTQILTADEAATAFGRGSMVHAMAVAAFTADAGAEEVWAVGVADNGAGVAASATIAFSVSSLEAGTLTTTIAGVAVLTTVEAADTATEIAAAVAADITALTDLVVTASSSSGTLTLTCRHKGTLGNDLDLTASFSATGLTATVTGFASGATDPDAQTALDACVGSRFDVIAWPWFEDMVTITDHVVLVSNGENQMPAVAVSAADETVSSLVSAAGDANSGRVVLAGLTGTASWPPNIAAACAAQLAAASDPGAPLNGLRVKGLVAPALADQYTRAEATTLLKNGVAPLIVAGSEVRWMRSITTYTTNGAGVPDTALLDVQTIRVLDYVRRVIRERLASRYQRKKLADKADTTGTTDPSKMRADIMAWLYELEAADIIDGVEELADAVTVARASGDTTAVDIDIPCRPVGGLHVTRGKIRLNLGA